jgi:hypothetical protein
MVLEIFHQRQVNKKEYTRAVRKVRRQGYKIIINSHINIMIEMFAKVFIC